VDTERGNEQQSDDLEKCRSKVHHSIVLQIPERPTCKSETTPRKEKKKAEIAREYALDDFDTLEQAEDLQYAQNLDYSHDPLATPHV
jgi:hypothetical protein